MRHFLTDRNVAFDALLVCLGILFGYVESLLLPQMMLPGMKLGISNVVILFALIQLSRKDAFIIAFIKILVNGLMFSGLTSIIYGVSGILLSIMVMSLLKRFYFTGKVSAIGISVLSSAVFNCGQLLAACLILKNVAPMYYFGYYMFLSVITGVVTGILVQIILNKGVVRNIEKKK